MPGSVSVCNIKWKLFTITHSAGILQNLNKENDMLKVKNVEKYYGSKNNVTKALDRVSFDVADGEFIAIMGASGSGKTTLLNCISTIDTVSAGELMLDG